MKRALALALVLAAGTQWGCGNAPGDAGDAGVFVALASDFADFTTWRRVDLGNISLAGHPPGPRVGYLYVPGPVTDGRYPLGTRIVKAIIVDGTGGRVEYFAMVKRGGGFNPDGAHEWEFFILRVDAENAVSIVSRGTNPSDGQSDPYAGIGLGCNTCHAVPGSAQYDYVISPLLQPGSGADAGP